MLGSIPSSVNLPLSSFEQALSLDESDFTRAYGFRKPKKSTPMIFFCKAGIRSASATSLAKSKGFSQVRNYPGSYADVSRSIHFLLKCSPLLALMLSSSPRAPSARSGRLTSQRATTKAAFVRFACKTL